MTSWIRPVWMLLLLVVAACLASRDAHAGAMGVGDPQHACQPPRLGGVDIDMTEKQVRALLPPPQHQAMQEGSADTWWEEDELYLDWGGLEVELLRDAESKEFGVIIVTATSSEYALPTCPPDGSERRAVRVGMSIDAATALLGDGYVFELDDESGVRHVKWTVQTTRYEVYLFARVIRGEIVRLELTADYS